MARLEPIAFMSYVRFNDRQDEGRLTKFQQRLSAEVQVHTGEPFHIFQDRSHILWGQNWRKRIEESLNAVTFLIPIITPSYFRSSACLSELARFIECEKRMGRDDLILPVYYVDYPPLNDPARHATDKLVKVIAAHHYADWRNLRFTAWNSPRVGRMLAELGMAIRDALDRVSRLP